MGSNQQALRRGRHSVPGGVYLLTFTTHRRVPVFAEPAAAFDAARAIVNCSAWPECRLLAWVLMPDHWHGLVQLGETMTLAHCVQRIKGSTSRSLGHIRPTGDALWAKGFHDRALRKDDDLLVAARYLLMNPVRAGIVARVGDYPFWDAVWIDAAVGARG